MNDNQNADLILQLENRIFALQNENSRLTGLVEDLSEALISVKQIDKLTGHGRDVN